MTQLADRTPWGALAVAVLLCTTLSVANGAPFSRIVEKPLDGPFAGAVKNRALSATPMVDPPRRIAGTFKLNRTHDAHMFYFFFESRSARAGSDPVVLWMTGGPGCSSELAVFYENGPYNLNKDGTLNETQFGWDAKHNMIFVDQPINTGFSYSDDRRDRVHGDEVLVGEDMLDFLWAFFTVHPELQENPFFVTGESYAGHYVPSVAHRIYRAKELGQGPFPINLKGLAIGNGLTVPAIQFPAYGEFALENKLIGQGLADSIGWWAPYCSWGARFCDAYNWKIACVIALEFCQVTTFGRILAANPDINVYDITKKCEGALCYDFTAMEEFLGRKDVRDALGVGTRPWQACSPLVYSDFIGDWLKSYDKLLPMMLEDDVRIMIYAGELDLICNWLGNERWVNAMEWQGQEDWGQVKLQDWKVGGKSAGSARELGGLTFVKVSKAGHMVPMDQPASALDMITRFTRGKSLITGEPVPQYALNESAKLKYRPDVAKLSAGWAAEVSAASAAGHRLHNGLEGQGVTGAGAGVRQGSAKAQERPSFLQMALGRKAAVTTAEH